MKKFVVGFYSLFDSELTLEIVWALNWLEAINMHSKVKEYDLPKRLEDYTGDLADIKQEMFDQDAAIDVLELT